MNKYGWIYFLLIIIIGFVTFFISLNNYFTPSDDFHFLEIVSGDESFMSKVFTSIGGTGLMPLQWAFSVFLFKLFSFNPFGYYFVHICFHIVNACLLFFLARNFLKNNFFSFISAIIFLLHRTTSGIVFWLGSIDTVLIVFFILLSLIFFFKYQNIKKKAHYYLWLLFFICALLSQITALYFLLVFILYELSNNKFKFKKIRISRYVPFVLISLVSFLSQLIAIIPNNYLFSEKAYFFGPHFIFNMLNYFVTLFFPSTNFMNASYSLSSFIPILYLVYFFIIVFIILIFIKGSNSVKFLTFWLLLAFIPGSFFIWNNALRFIYLPLIPFSILISYALKSLFNKINLSSKTKIFFLSSIIVIFIIFSMYFIRFDEKNFENSSDVARKIIIDFEEVSSLIPDNSIIRFDFSRFSCYHLAKGLEAFYDIKNISFYCGENEIYYTHRTFEDFLEYNNIIYEEVIFLSYQNNRVSITNIN